MRHIELLIALIFHSALRPEERGGHSLSGGGGAQPHHVMHSHGSYNLLYKPTESYLYYSVPAIAARRDTLLRLPFLSSAHPLAAAVCHTLTPPPSHQGSAKDPRLWVMKALALSRFRTR